MPKKRNAPALNPRFVVISTIVILMVLILFFSFSIFKSTSESELTKSPQKFLRDTSKDTKSITEKIKEIQNFFNVETDIIPFYKAQSAKLRYRDMPNSTCINLDELKDENNVVHVTEQNMNYTCPEAGLERCARVCAGLYEVTQVNIDSDEVYLYCEDLTSIHGNGSNRGIFYGDIYTPLSNIKILNCDIQNFAFGILGVGSDVEIADNIVSSVGISSIAVKGWNMNVERNRVSSPYTGIGIIFAGLDYQSVLRENNIVSSYVGDHDWGIYTSGGQIVSNSMDKNGYGIVIYSIDLPVAEQGYRILHVQNNFVSDPYWYGVYINFEGADKENLLFEDNRIITGEVAIGILLDNINSYELYNPLARFTIKNNTVLLNNQQYHNTPGIYLRGNDLGESHPGSIVKKNTVSGARGGIIVNTQVGNITVTANEISNSYPTALSCSNSQNIIWSCNDCNGGTVENENCAPPAFCEICEGSNMVLATFYILEDTGAQVCRILRVGSNNTNYYSDYTCEPVDVWTSENGYISINYRSEDLGTFFNVGWDHNEISEIMLATTNHFIKGEDSEVDQQDTPVFVIYAVSPLWERSAPSVFARYPISLFGNTTLNELTVYGCQDWRLYGGWRRCLSGWEELNLVSKQIDGNNFLFSTLDSRLFTAYAIGKVR